VETIENQIDPVVLAQVIRRACADQSLALESWQVQPIAYPNLRPDSRGLYRVAGTARAADRCREWSVVLKLLGAPPDAPHDDPAQPFYWKREALAYASDLLQSGNQAVGLAAPRCWLIDQRSERQIWLWLEDLASSGLERWPIERYALAAHDLGRYQGALLADRELPNHAWLSRGLIRAWVDDSAPLIERIARTDVWSLPLLQAFPASVAPAVVALWHDRERFFAALERQPQTLCHHDLWRNNLFARSTASHQEQTIAIDWELVGLGAAGEDLGNLLGVSLLNVDVAAEDAPELADRLLQSYLAGLHAAGWRGDPQPIQLVYRTTAALRCVFSTTGWPVSIALDPERYVADTEQRWQRPIEQIMEQWAATTLFLLDQARQARSLIDR
jgi:hypothetical protein